LLQVGFQLFAFCERFLSELRLVGCELFPVMVNAGEKPSYIGISVGFSLGLALIYGLEYFVHQVEEHDGDIWAMFSASTHALLPTSVHAADGKGIRKLDGIEFTPVNEEERELEAQAQWEDEDVIEASKALSQPAHRGHIREHLLELIEALKHIDAHSKQLVNPTLSNHECERIAELIDEQIHALQYKLDHSRRLV
jgi:hypothetical protein